MPDVPFFSGIPEKFQQYGDTVIDDKLLGHGLQALQTLLSGGGRFPIVQNTPLGMLAAGPQDANEATRKGLTGKAWVDEAYKNSPWQKMIAQTVVDPLNVVGMGLPGAALRSLPAASKIAPALKVLDFADKVPGRVTEPVLGLAGQGVSKAVGQVGNFVRPEAARFGAMHPAVAENSARLMRAWREQALLSPGYHVRNLTENALRPALEGDFKTAGETVRGTFTGKNRYDFKAADYGLDQDLRVQKAINQDPTGMGDDAKSVFRDLTYKPPSAAPTRVPPPAAGTADGTLLNHVGVNETSGAKQYQGLVMNGDAVQLGDTANFRTKSGGGRDARIIAIEDDGPQGAARFTVQLPDGSTARVSPHSMQYLTREGKGWGAPGQANWLQQGWNKGVAGVSRAMETNRTVGMLGEGQARKAAVITEYERAIEQGATHDQAVKAGVDYADKLFFNYADKGTADEIGRNLFAFHKFSVNNLPAQLTAAGQRPALLNVPSQYYRSSDQYNAKKGLPSRFHGELPLGSGGWHINPMNLWSVGQLTGGLTQRSANDDEGTGIGQAADMAETMGLGLNPFIDALLTVTGQHGRSFAPSFLRASQPVNGVLSAVAGKPVDLEGGPKELLGNIQEGITGQRPFPYQEYLMRKRQAELGAFSKDPKQAGSDVGRQLGIEGLAGFMGVPGLKLLTPEEQKIRQNSALAKAYKLAGNDPAYRANPTARTYADLDPRDEQIRNWSELSAAERQRLLRDPEVRDQLLDKLALQLHNTASTTASNREKARTTNPFGLGAKGAQSRDLPQKQQR